MREEPSPLPPPPPAHSIHGHNHTPTPPSSTSCDGYSCRWRPYSGTGDFEANAAMILIILLCALICALALNTAIRCFLRGQRPQQQQQQQRQHEQQKSNNVAVLPALVVYSAGLKGKLAGAETAAECAICLSELEEGQGIRVMGRCNHGFHDLCIHQWLSSHSSCPTCRTTCLPP